MVAAISSSPGAHRLGDALPQPGLGTGGADQLRHGPDVARADVLVVQLPPDGDDVGRVVERGQRLPVGGEAALVGVDQGRHQQLGHPAEVVVDRGLVAAGPGRHGPGGGPRVAVPVQRGDGGVQQPAAGLVGVGPPAALRRHGDTTKCFSNAC